MRTRERLIIATCLYAVATAGVGWWAVPVVAAAWGALDRGTERPAADAALGAALGWSTLLAGVALHGSPRAFASTLGGVLHLPGWAVFVVTLAFAAALAAAAAGLAHALRVAAAGPERARGRPPR